MPNIFNAGISAMESEAEKLRDEMVNIIHYYKFKDSAKNFTNKFTSLLHPTGHLSIDVNLELAPDLHILAEKFLYIIPLCFVLTLIIVISILLITCKSKRDVCGYCTDDYYRHNKINESIY